MVCYTWKGKGNQVMDNTIRVFSGRTFSSEEIELIIWTRKKYPQLSHNELAKTICEFLEWKTPAGRDKVPQCREFLEILETEGLLNLPPKTIQKKRIKKELSNSSEPTKVEYTEIIGSVEDFEPITLEIARFGENLKKWRTYVNQYHMLGDKMVFGSRLHYFIKSGEKELGCIQFSASSWALEERERWIEWSLEDRKARLNLIINNSRYLIFPWVRIKNLASKVLSLAVKQLQEDWLKEYCYAPVLIETFVDLEHFKGTCYKASNWIYLGETKGRGRQDRYNKNNLSKKSIFMYPLQKDFKEVLKGEKPFKAVTPDE
jgi:hypothetical protein